MFSFALETLQRSSLSAEWRWWWRCQMMELKAKKMKIAEGKATDGMQTYNKCIGDVWNGNALERETANTLKLSVCLCAHCAVFTLPLIQHKQNRVERSNSSKPPRFHPQSDKFTIQMIYTHTPWPKLYRIVPHCTEYTARMERWELLERSMCV